MPVYTYRCQLCGNVDTVTVPYSDRLFPQTCSSCGGRAQYEMSAPTIGTERKRGDARLIMDERQVTSEHGARWRDAGTTGREGGAGGKLTFDQGAKS
jgi:putative FmdB family regulatory protein